MPICRFKTSELKRCINHALASTKWETPGKEWETNWEDMKDSHTADPNYCRSRPRYSDSPCLLFVHDSGVYLMSNGTPQDLDESEQEEKSYVVYAEDCKPVRDEDCWETSRALVGGDDFVETIPIPQSWVDACDEFETFEITITGNTIDCGFVDPILLYSNT